MTMRPEHRELAPAVGTRALPSGGGDRFRSATGKLVGLALIAVVVMVAIALGGFRVDDSGERWQQVIAGTLAAVGAVTMVVGLVRARTSVRDDVLDLSGLGSARTVLTTAAVTAWLAFVVLWVLGLSGDGSSNTITVAAVLSIPIGGAAIVATLMRCVPARILQI